MEIASQIRYPEGMIPLVEPRPQGQAAFPLMASGHRPFFLAAALYGTLAIPLWLAGYLGYLPLTPVWHGHEMVFGFVVAAVTGFLLAAVPKWTNGPPILGASLVFLIVLWILGRIGMWHPVTAYVDLLFLPVFAGFILWDVVRARNTRNYQVPAMLLLLAAFNALYHFYDPSLALRVSIYVIAAMIALIGGRIVPAFTQNALRMKVAPEITCSTPPVLDRLAVPAVLLVVAVELVYPASAASGAMSIVAAGILFARMLGWQTLRTARLPLVWILHVGYAWVPLGFLLHGLALMGAPLDASAALHALSAGAAGVMILAVASRAALGHSGRPLEPSPWTVVSYYLVIAAAVVRVFVPVPTGILISGLLWFLGYGLFAAVYWPILTRPRVDGLPG
ncbi:MAG: NnrS family protein [Rhodospirillales bacterium]|nr:NnrS family protein [Rhodospirillales bacterium]